MDNIIEYDDPDLTKLFIGRKVVKADNAGSKLTKAQGFGIMVVGQDEFLMMV